MRGVLIAEKDNSEKNFIETVQSNIKKVFSTLQSKSNFAPIRFDEITRIFTEILHF